MSGTVDVGARRAISSRLEFTLALCRFSGRVDGSTFQ